MPERRNVMVVANYESDVGYAWWMMERFWTQIARTCEEEGTRCFVAYPRINTLPEPVERSPLEPLELRVEHGPTSTREEVARVVAARSVGALYFTDRPFRDPLYRDLRREGVEVVVNHDHTPGDRPPTKGFRGLLASLLNRMPRTTADLWVAISPHMRRRALLASRIPADRCVVVQNGIDASAPGRAVRVEARTRLGLEQGEVAVVSVGRAIRYKGVDFSIALAQRARDAGLDRTVFIHLGDGPHLEAFREDAASRGLGDRFRFPGRVDDVPTLLEGCDVAIHPSHGEGFSLAVLEYMRASLPVLVPDRPSVCQAIEHGRTGLVFRRDDLDDALAALGRLVESERSREEMGRAARETMLERYTWSRTASEFQAVADYLVGRAGRPVQAG